MRFFLKFLFSIHPAFLTLGIMLVVVMLFLLGTPILDLIELKTYDLRLRSRDHLQPSPAVVLALIDEKSLVTEGRWPWPRSKIAALVDLLSQDGARVIGFAMAFLEPDESSQLAAIQFSQKVDALTVSQQELVATIRENMQQPDNDLALANAIKHSSAAVVLGYFFHMSDTDLDYRLEQQEIDQQLKRISASKYPFIMYQEHTTSFRPFFRAHAPKSNLEMFTEAAASSGHFSLRSDQDGVVRRMPLMIQGGEDVFPPLTVLCVWHYLDKPQLTVEVGRYGVNGIRMGQRFIPTDENGELLINYLGPRKTFPHFSIGDILSGKLPSGTFTDKIVLVGATAIGTHDLLPTPLSTVYPGVEIHATVIDNILTQRFLTTPQRSRIYDLLAIIILGALIGIALPRIGALKGLLCATGLVIVYIVIARWLFVNAGVWLNIVYPLVVVSTNYLGHSFNSIAQQLQQAFGNLQASEQKYRSLFADIVLLRTLVFRVEQVFLIHHHTGLLLLHVAADPTTTRDPDMISGMLTAIQDFVQDSFGVSAEKGPGTFQVGELTVWIEQDRVAVLAAVIRGDPPQTVRTLLRDTLATIHREHADALATFTGDARPFETSRPHLAACLVTQTAPHTRKISPRFWRILGVHGLGSGWGIVSKIQANRRWARYVQTLQAEPGIVVTAAAKRRGNYRISGLRDPMAADPRVAIKAFDIDPAHVVSHWESYYALSPAFILARAKQVLNPPEMVTLHLDNGVLSATGTASHAWIETTRRQACLIPGITQFQEDNLLDADVQQLEAIKTLLAPPETVTLRLADGIMYATGTAPHAWILESRQRLLMLVSTVIYRDDQLIDDDLQRFAVLKERIENTVPLFLHGTVQFVPGQEEKLARLVVDMQLLSEVACVLGKHLRVSIIGHTDQSGLEKVNQPLSQQRADYIRAMLIEHGLEARSLSAVGIATKAALRAETTAADQAFNRSVSFQVVVSNALR